MRSDSGLQALGLTEAEQRVYELLLDRTDVSSLAEIAAVVGISAGLVRRALAALAAMGLVSRSPGPTRRWVPARPDLAVEALIARRQEELERARLTATTGLLERFHRGVQAGGVGELVEVVDGREAFAQRYLQLGGSATTEVMAFDKPPYITETAECNETELAALRRGVRWRGIYTHAALDRPGRLQLLHHMGDAGEEARSLKEVPVKLIIVDRRLALIPLELQPGQERAVLIHASSLLDALVRLFEVLWDRAAPVNFPSKPGRTPESIPDDEGTQVPAEHDDLAALLVAGLKPEAIARQLKWSPSKVQRRINQLMECLGAETRVQLGYQLATLSLCSPGLDGPAEIAL